MKKLILTCLLLLLFIPSVFAQPISVNFIDIDTYKTTADQTTLIDVRSKNSRTNSKMGVPGAIWIDPASGQALQDFIAKSDKTKSYTIFCSCVDDNYSIRAAQLLIKNGFQDVKVLKGGWDLIKNSGIEIAPLDLEGK